MPNALRLDGMTTSPQGTLEQWQRGIVRMRELGSQFVAIYGAEPLMRPQMLPEVINMIRAVGMECTVITALPDSDMMQTIVNKSNLESITMSYDLFCEDPDRREKTASTQNALLKFQNVRDRAVVVTVTKDNVNALPDIVRAMTAIGVWTLFDIFHSTAGKFSKCGHDGETMSPRAWDMSQTARELRMLKDEGMLVHASDEYLKLVQHNYDGNPRNLWHCSGKPTGWLTVDADGSILACDDWQRPYPEGKIWDGFDEGDLERWIQPVRAECVGCAWNTHVDACLIEEGAPLGTYVHPSVPNAPMES